MRYFLAAIMRERDVVVIIGAVGGIVIIQLAALLAGINGVLLKSTIVTLGAIVGWVLRNIHIRSKRLRRRKEKK